MNAALAAFHNLRRLASADGEVCHLEKKVLNRYRRALRIRSRDLRKVTGCGLITQESIVDTPRECAHALKMMARVAFADGLLGKRARPG